MSVVEVRFHISSIQKFQDCINHIITNNMPKFLAKESIIPSGLGAFVGPIWNNASLISSALYSLDKIAYISLVTL